MWRGWVSQIYFPLVQYLRQGNVINYLRILERSQWWKEEKLGNWQNLRLRQIVRYALKNIPFYRISVGKFPEPEFFRNPGRYWADFPFLAKETLQQHLAEFQMNKINQRVYSGRTSGSTGLSTQFFYDEEFTSWDWASRWRARRWWGVNIGDREVALWGRPVHFNRERLWGLSKGLLKNQLLLNAFDLTPARLAFFWRLIKFFRPVYIYGYPTVINQLALFVEDEEGQAVLPNLKVIFVTGETLLTSYRERIERVFNCPIANEYGCSELGGFAYECPRGNLHISSELVKLEVIEEDTSNEELGRLVGSSLTNYLMPLLRYRIGDIGKFRSDICPCGRSLPLLELNLAKEEEVIVTQQGKIISSKLFDYINLALLKQGLQGIQQFKVYQLNGYSFSLLVVPNTPNPAPAVEFFVTQMKKFFGETIRVEISYLQRIPPEPSGKLRYFVPRQDLSGK